MVLALPASSVSADTEINLSGAWRYCLLESEKDYPPAGDVAWEQVKLPNRDLFEIIAERKNITSGFILYRKTITVEAVSRDPLVFQAGEIMNTDMVFINGVKIGNTGVFPPDFKSGWSKFRHYPVPGNLLVRGDNTIDIICYFNAELWVLSPLRIIDETRGNWASMARNFLQIDLIHAFCLLQLCLSLFFLLIFIKRKKEKVYFYYAGTSFFLADMMILQFVENLYTFIPLSSDAIFKICGLGPMYFPPFLAFFFRSYLDLKVSWKRIAVYLSLPLALALLMLFSQDRYYIILWRNVFLLLIPLYMLEIVAVSLRQLMAGNRKGLLLFMSLLPIFILGVYDILVFSLHALEGGVPLYPLGIPFMMILIGVQLVNRFIHTLNASERLNLLLQEKMEEGKRLASLENELSIARRIQLANVPRTLPDVQSFTIGVKYIPAENISGDFYNFHTVERDKLGVLIADVSGHGVPASLIASMLKVLFGTLTPLYERPVEFLRGLNGSLYDKMEGNFLTAGYCYIDRAAGKAFFARAGHEPLLHISYKTGEAELHEYKSRGMAIGFRPDIDTEVMEFAVTPGDRIILYTDGLIEAFGGNREMFGVQRLKNVLMQSREMPIEKSIESVYGALMTWSSFRALEDDFTFIMIGID